MNHAGSSDVGMGMMMSGGNAAGRRSSGILFYMNNNPNRLIRKGEISVALYDGEKIIHPGMAIEVARYCCDSPVGNRGIIHGWRQTPRDIKIIVDYGLNAGGQRLLKPYPSNVLRLISK